MQVYLSPMLVAGGGKKGKINESRRFALLFFFPNRLPVWTVFFHFIFFQAAPPVGMT
ncbi:hypothetical protein J2Z49_000939 [Desulfofundulus luciae]|uniref:Uncharacterized protein n=1 Tax=Desulfofundulus luciae TaxID=74702 RepID=A0ABU0B0N1_9FIRM|nr:hypothetical protein [Desulfofundulus luciae]MDQ0285834.1 hypothetical protein [Desulfofundulus luciae]